MRIMMVGGGSGGHTTPLKAVAQEVYKQAPDSEITVVTDRKFSKQATEILEPLKQVKLKTIFAGKLRRYNTKSFLWHVVHLPTLLSNIVDIFKLGIGTLQLTASFIKEKPSAVFCKGGFVSVPAGVVARLFRVPLIIHDSDTHPGLSSRIISRWARTIATGMPEEYYPYPKNKMKYTGIPVDKKFQPVGEGSRRALKKELKLDPIRPLLIVTGGGMGAVRLNQAIMSIAEELIEAGWQIAHSTGKNKLEEVEKFKATLSLDQQKFWRVGEFINLAQFVPAADVAVVRTGASTMQELANAQKVVITIPSKYLTGGHQLKNAAMFEQAKAAIVLNEDAVVADSSLLTNSLKKLRDEPENGLIMAKMLHTRFAKPKAARELAEIILRVAAK